MNELDGDIDQIMLQDTMTISIALQKCHILIIVFRINVCARMLLYVGWYLIDICH